jgi:hypothetical protein
MEVFELVTRETYASDVGRFRRFDCLTMLACWVCFLGACEQAGIIDRLGLVGLENCGRVASA